MYAFIYMFLTEVRTVACIELTFFLWRRESCLCCLASLSNSRKIETGEAVFNHSNTAWREEGADSNTRSEEQFCDLAVMLKN